MASTFDLRNQLSAEFDGESDRGCAVLTICLLEESLVVLLGRLLPGGDADARHFLPRGRLSVGVANALKLGLLDHSTAETFKILLQIRNIFAHGTLSGVNFQTEAVREKVNRLALPNMDAVPDVLLEINSSSRRRYMMAVDNVFFTLNEIKNRVVPLQVQQVPTMVLARPLRTVT